MKKSETLRREGDEVRAVREALGWSRAQMAKRVGVSTSTIANVENAQQRMGSRTLNKVRSLVSASADEDKGAQHEMCEQAETYRSSPGRSRSIDEQELVRAIAASRDEETLRVATDMTRVTGLSLDEALAVIVKKRLESGK